MKTVGSPLLVHNVHSKFADIPRGDQFVKYTCENVISFPGKLQDVRDRGYSTEDAKRLLCEDPEFALRFGSATYDYTKGLKWNGVRVTLAADHPFDIESIMMYGSLLNNNEALCKATPNSCPLARIGQNGALFGMDIITKPSTTDVAFVRKYYPWTSGGSSVDELANITRRDIIDENILNKRSKGDGTASYLLRTRIESNSLDA